MMITITVIGAERLAAIIAQGIKIKGQGKFAVGPHGSIFLIDADSIEGRKSIARGIADNHIILTFNPASFEHQFVLKSPLKLEDFLNMISQVSKLGLTENKIQEKKVTATQNPFAKFQDPQYLASLEKKKITLEVSPKLEIKSNKEVERSRFKVTDYEYWSNYFLENKLELYQLLELKSKINKNCEVSYDSRVWIDNHFKDVSHYSVWAMRKALQEKFAKNSTLFFEYQQFKLLVFTDGILISNMSVADWELLASLENDEVKLQLLSSHQLIEEKLREIDFKYYAEANRPIWLAILLASRGCLIKDKALDESIGLLKIPEDQELPQHMPYIEDVLNIWRFRRVSLLDTIELLPDIAPYYIFTYYNLCDLAGLIGHDVDKNRGKRNDLNMLLSELQKL